MTPQGDNPDRGIGYGVPLETHSIEWLASEVRMLHAQAKRRDDDWQQATAQIRREHAILVRGIRALVPYTLTRKTVAVRDVQAILEAIKDAGDMLDV